MHLHTGPAVYIFHSYSKKKNKRRKNLNQPNQFYIKVKATCMKKYRMHENRFFLPIYIIWFCFYPVQAPFSMCISVAVASSSCLFHYYFFFFWFGLYYRFSFSVFPFLNVEHNPEAIENPRTLHVPQMKWKGHNNLTLKEKKIIGTTECICMVYTTYRAQSTKCGLCIL